MADNTRKVIGSMTVIVFFAVIIRNNISELTSNGIFISDKKLIKGIFKACKQCKQVMKKTTGYVITQARHIPIIPYWIPIRKAIVIPLEVTAILMRLTVGFPMAITARERFGLKFCRGKLRQSN